MAAPKVPVVSTPACGVSRVSTAVTVSPARESDTTMSARATLASPSVKPTVPVRLVASTTALVGAGVAVALKLRDTSWLATSPGMPPNSTT